MRIALVKPPVTYADWYKRPVLGLTYIAACIEQKGFGCRIFDAYFHSWSGEELLERVLEYEPDVVGFTAMTHEIKQAGSLAASLKKRSKVVTVVGGCHVTALPERTLEEFPGFDYGVSGEGERTFLELLQYLGADRATEPVGVPGLVFRSNGVRANGPRAPMTSAELNALPIPAFHDYYSDDPHALATREAEYVLVSGRGCPFGCSFCMRVLGQKVRRRSADSVCREMESAIAEYGAHTFDFEDDVMLIDNEDTRELLHRMIDIGIPGRARWSGMIHAAFVKPELVELAKRAGCYRMWMGVESGDDEILRKIHKNITVEQVRKAVRVVKQAGIQLGTFFILGHPGETGETVRKTIDLMVELNADAVAVGLMVPYPGTEIYEMASRGECGYRLLTDDWSEYDKYGGKVLEVAGLPWGKLAKAQRSALVRFYFRNLRLADLAGYAWKRRRALWFLVRKRLAPSRQLDLTRVKPILSHDSQTKEAACPETMKRPRR